jgi:hypothetical protein
MSTRAPGEHTHTARFSDCGSNLASIAGMSTKLICELVLRDTLITHGEFCHPCGSATRSR